MRLSADMVRVLVPFVALAALLAGVFWLRPNAAGYTGLNLLFNLAVPLALATLAQMFVIAVGDLDLSMGAFVSFVACVTATFLNDTPMAGVLILAGSVGVYAALGVVIHLWRLPAIVVTLGMSFVWTGLAVMILPAPGGAAPEWIRALMTVKPPMVPMAIVASVVIAVVAHLVIARSSLGVLIRGWAATSGRWRGRGGRSFGPRLRPMRSAGCSRCWRGWRWWGWRLPPMQISRCDTRCCPSRA